MPQKTHKPEEIVAKLRQVDVFVSQGQSVAEAVRSIGVTQTPTIDGVRNEPSVRHRSEDDGERRREGLKVPQEQPKKSRLWFNDGSCIRLRPERPNHVWSYDFVESRTHDGRRFRMLNLIDEFTRDCLAIRIERRLRSTDVIDVLSDQFILRGVPDHIRSDNGPEFVAKAVREWIAAVGARTAYIEPRSPWENGYCESFNAKLRAELLNGEIFYSLAEAKIVIESWRQPYNTKRPHSSLSYRPPAPEVVPWPASPSGAASPATPAVAPRPVMH